MKQILVELVKGVPVAEQMREVDVGVRVRKTLDAIPDIKAAELLFPGTETDTQQMFAKISHCRGI